MTPPGLRLRSVAARLFNAATLERLIDPLIADLQHEHAEAVRDGRRWRARWIRIAGGIAFCKVAAMGLFAADSRGARAVAIALSAGTLITALAIGAALAGTPATIHTRGNMAWLVLYLVPQALTISMPICLALGLFVWIRGAGADASAKRVALWLMRLALFLAVVNTGWVTPAANSAYRNINAGATLPRGVNELSFIELGQRIRQDSLENALDGQLPMAFWLNARLSLTIAPVLLGVLALAGAAARGRAAAITVVATLTIFAGCCLLVTDDEIAALMRWLPAAMIAWLPNVLAMIATVIVAAGRRHDSLPMQRS